ncbi:brachyurin-like [Sabethes cyaneus]|uniref:brachyurin-like n=1 Tax=Sabethes cyaneus TaxID=53552 RepID=UPI00237D3499|nr:brachyurin-like [Sabethes cyaneus]
MKSVLLVIATLAVVSAEWIEVDWTQVKPIEEFDHYWARIPQEWQFLRKLTPSRRITNGQEASRGQFPYYVVVLSDFAAGTGLCGATVLTTNYILTAAHCVHNAQGGLVIVGAHDRTAEETHSQQRILFEASGIKIHDGYAPTSVRNDVAVVRLFNSITYSNWVTVVRIPNSADSRHFAGLTGTVSGFGRTSDSSMAEAAVIRFASNPILTEADCLSQWGNDVNLIQSQQICLSGEGGRSPCNGDSGGPLTVSEGPGLKLQVGIVSFGSAAGCSIGMPSVYARVTHFRQWIVDNSDYPIN